MSVEHNEIIFISASQHKWVPACVYQVYLVLPYMYVTSTTTRLSTGRR